MWPLALLLIAGTCSAQDAGRADDPLLLVSPPDTCIAFTQQNASIDLAIPHSCCHFNTQECFFRHNGVCKRRWDTGNCDYTIDVCHRGTSHKHWFCTCCASCDGPQDSSQCKKDGGVCRRSCYKYEYFAWWRQCSGKNCCRCCKEFCVQKTCANGNGRCLHSSQPCPKGYYISSESCKGFGCRCCVRCKSDQDCTNKKGFCEWTKRKCPLGYLDKPNCHCPEKECRCCHQDWNHGGPQVFSAKVVNQMEVNFGQGGAEGDVPEGEDMADEDEQSESSEDEPM